MVISVVVIGEVVVEIVVNEAAQEVVLGAAAIVVALVVLVVLASLNSKLRCKWFGYELDCMIRSKIVEKYSALDGCDLFCC